MRMKNPPHPGEHVLEDCLEPLGLSITKGADVLGVTRLTLSNLVNGKNGVSPEMAIRLSKAFGGSPEVCVADMAAAGNQGVVGRWVDRWEGSEDYKTWTFKLRPGVKFHDGTAFDAQALKFNFDRQKDPKNKCRCAFYIAFIKEVQAADPLTAVYVLTDPSVHLPKIMAFASSNNVMQSPTAMQGRGDDYNRNPVGSGPFILKSWTAGDRMVLERNPGYWNAGRPYLDRVVLRPLPVREPDRITTMRVMADAA